MPRDAATVAAANDERLLCEVLFAINKMPAAAARAEMLGMRMQTN